MKEIPIYLQTEDESPIPVYATHDSAGADLRAAISESIWIEPGESKLIPTGLKMEIPSGFEVQIRPRSGLAFKYQITVLNSPGTIDADYRGEVGIILINHGKNRFEVTPKMRIAQMVVAPICQAIFERKELLSTSSRGEGGFGHSGVE